MQLDVHASLDASPECVVERLHDIAQWTSWMEGLDSVEVIRPGKHAEAVLVFRSPRRFTLRMDIDCQRDGLFCSLIEGEVTGVQAELRVAPDQTGSLVTWSLYLHFPLTVPGALLTELRTELLPRWSRALAQSESDRAAD